VPFTPTHQQVEIGEMVVVGEDGKVIAFAGTGKSTTCHYSTGLVPRRKVQGIAFNRTTADEGNQKSPRNARWNTAHSLAYRPTIGHFGGNRDRFKGTMGIVRGLEDHRSIAPLIELAEGDNRAAALIAVRTLLKFMQSDARTPQPDHVPAPIGATEKNKKRRADLRAAVANTALNVWLDMTAEGSDLPINDDVYLKYWALSNPRIAADLIFFDEAQDANGVMLGVVRAQQCQQVYVGDPHQQIYGFRGAVNAMSIAPGRELALTESFRFGPNVASWANVILAMLGEHRPLIGAGPFEGEVYDDPMMLYHPATRLSGNGPQAVLCRGNAGVVREAVEALDAGLTTTVVGGVGDAVWMLSAAFQLYQGHRPNHPEIGLFKDWEEMIEFSESDEGGSLRPIIRIVEQHRGGIPALCDRLKAEIVDEKAPGVQVVITTAHKAKGREWDYVRFSEDFGSLVEEETDREGVPTGRVKLATEEANLAYVSVTRAQRVLNLAGFGYQLTEDARAMGTLRDDQAVGA
jgi:hypothetical protein